MENESETFALANLRGFVDALRDRDRRQTAERLERVTARMADLAARIPDDAALGEGRTWNALEVLAHIASFSAFFTALACSSDATAGIDMVQVLQKRDALGMSNLQQPVAELVAMAQADHRRARDWLLTADIAALERRVPLGDIGSMGAEEVVRLIVCTHVEEHVEQLEAALGRQPEPAWGT